MQYKKISVATLISIAIIVLGGVLVSHPALALVFKSQPVGIQVGDGAVSATEAGDNLIYGVLGSSATGNLLLLQNGTGVDEFKVEVDGDVQLYGELKLQNTASKPTCSSGNTGALVFDTVNDQPFVCTSAGWKPLDSDADKDGITDAIDINDSDANDATASAGAVLSGSTFYAGGAAQTGSMANIGAQNITPGTSAQTLTTGYHNGNGSVAGDVDLVASNIVSGVDIFGVAGTASNETPPPGCGSGDPPSEGTSSADHCDNDHDSIVDEQIDLTTYEVVSNPHPSDIPDSWAYLGGYLISVDNSSHNTYCERRFGAGAVRESVGVHEGTSGQCDYGSGAPDLKCAIWNGSSWVQHDNGTYQRTATLTCRVGNYSYRYD